MKYDENGNLIEDPTNEPTGEDSTGDSTEDPSSSTEDPSTDDSSGEEPSGEDQPVDKSHRKPGAEKRINQLTAEKYHLQQKIRELEQANRSMPDSQEDGGGKKTAYDLNPDDFTSDADYLKAFAKQLESDLTSKIEGEKKQRQQAEQQERISSYAKKGRETYQDFDSVALNPNVPVTQEMLDASMGDNWHDIMYALGSEPEEAARIASLSPVQQAKEIGKIETRVSSKGKKKTTNAPNPPPKVQGSGGSPPKKDEGKMSRSELHQKWKKDREERIKARYG